MSRRLKVLALVNVVGWVVVLPLLAGTVLRSFVQFDDWTGSGLLDRPAQDAPLAGVPGGRLPGAAGERPSGDAVAPGVRGGAPATGARPHHPDLPRDRRA